MSPAAEKRKSPWVTSELTALPISLFCKPIFGLDKQESSLRRQSCDISSPSTLNIGQCTSLTCINWDGVSNWQYWWTRSNQNCQKQDGTHPSPCRLLRISPRVGWWSWGTSQRIGLSATIPRCATVSVFLFQKDCCQPRSRSQEQSPEQDPIAWLLSVTCMKWQMPRNQTSTWIIVLSSARINYCSKPCRLLWTRTLHLFQSSQEI